MAVGVRDEAKTFDMKLCSLMRKDFQDKMLLTYFLINKSDTATSQPHVNNLPLRGAVCK